MSSENRTTVTGYGGVPLSVVTAGDPRNPPILLVHGWSQAAQSWSAQIAALADKFFLVAPDLRGHGASAKPDERAAYSSDAWAGDIAAVIGALGIDRPVVVGWSMGGYVVQDYLRVQGDSELSGVVLIGTGVTKGSFLPEAARVARAANPAVTASGMLDEDLEVNLAATRAFVRVCSEAPVGREDFEATVAFNMACPPHIRGFCRLRPEDYREVAGKLTVPVMAAWGDRDQLAHRSTFEELLATIPTAEPRIYEGLGHMPFAEDPDAFNADLARFADRCFERSK